MRIKHRKIFISGTAVVAAGVLGIGTLIQTSLSVQASAEMMPGIETIVDENSSEKPFRILELVNNSADAEIGYYVSGQEPYIKLYTWQYQDENGDTQTMHFSSLEEGLKKLPTAKLRQEFAANVRLNSDGEIDTTTSTGIRSASGFSGNDVPVTYSDYEEKYFLSSGDTESDWTKIDFTDPTGNKSRTDEVEIKGQYEENTSHTGDYTKGEQEYYPITGNTVDSSKELYRENIQNFYFSESDEDSRGSYDLDFESVTNDTINNNLSAGENNTLAKEYDPDNGHFGLYENVYEDLTSVIVANIQNNTYTFPGEKTTRDESAVKKIYGNSTSQIAETPDFSAGDAEDSESTNTTSGTEEGSAQAEFGSDTSSQSAASDAQTGSDVSFENSFSDSTVDAASDTDSDEWDVSESGSDSADSGSDFGSDFSDEGTDEAAVSTEDAGTGDAVDVGDDFSNDGSDGGSEIADTGDGSGNSTGDASEGETTSAEETIGSTELANSIANVRNSDTHNDENGKEVSPDTTGDSPGSQSNPYIYVSEQINVFPYYKYTKLGTLEYVKQKQEDVENREDGTRLNGDIVLENDQYYYYMVTDDGTTVKYPLTVVTGRQPVSYQDIQKIPESLGYDYYYRVSAVYFCCQESTDQSTGYKFIGWYYVNYQDQSNIYIKTESKDIATYYISDASYTLTPGTGDYDFVPDERADTQNVQVDHIYYKGGYTNNDWFKKYVFHLEPKESTDDEDGEFENFNIQVDTMNAGSTGNSLEGVYAEPSKSESSDTDAAGQADDSEISVDDSTEEDADSVGENGSDTTQSDTEAEFSDDTEIAETGSESSIQDADDSAENNDEADVDAQADISIEEESTDSAGDGVSTDDAGTLEDALSEYDLIYVNGELSIKMASALETAVTENTIPCIINNAKDGVANSLSESMQTDFVKDASADEDGHYVNKYVYFFKNNLDEDTTAQSQLLNVNFHTNFNDNADREDDYEASENALGFEEILKYIESENKYRALGGTNDTSQSSDSSADVSDGNTDGSTDGSSTDATNETLDPLSREISQARAIEYIINYKYKRVISGKEQINVLEITPDKLSKEDLTETDVLSWVNGKARDTISVCCYHNGNGKDKLEDGDGGTYWDFAWQSGDVNKDHDGNHYIEAQFTEAEDITGFSYTPRQGFNLNAISGGSCNGILKSYKAVLTYANGTTKEISGSVNITKAEKYDITFPKEQHSVEKMKIEFTDAYSSTGAKMASCAEFSVLYANPSDDDKVNTSIVKNTMTASEFVGHIDDIGSEYDLIYISDSNKYSNADNLITGAVDLRYTHVGEGKLLKWPSSEEANKVSLSKLLGILDIDYYRNADGTRWEGKIWNYNGGVVEDGNRFESYTKYSEKGAGYYRGSGNDITKQQYTELMNFVKSGYPIVLGNGLVSGSSVDSSEVGASSWYYQFLTDALKYDNVMTRDQAGTDSALEFYMNLAKPQIEFDEKPVEVERAAGTDGQKGTENDGKKYGYITDGQLKYVFKITNNSDVAPASTTYDCRLYMDLNFDGNMSEKENQQKYIEIQDESGNVLSRNSEGQYELKIGKKYTLIRKIPSDYYKVINWKLVLSSNRNSYIHVSETGYAKQQKTDGKQQINVLQLVPDSYNSAGQQKKNACTWNLANDLESDTTFKKLLSEVSDFDLKIEQLMVSDIGNMTYEDMKNKLDSQQMLIIGFADVYQDIPNENGQVKAILEYIQSGRSVIFSHDTTSYVNYDKTKMNNDIGTYTADDTNPLNVYGDSYLTEQNVANVTWGLSLNSTLRSVVGMDRYGVTSDEKITTADGNATTVGALTRKGEVLTNSNVDLATLMELAGDVAYTDGSKSETYVQTQGYSNGVIENTILSHSTTATKVNEGAITEYPFKLGDINVSETHGQYYQLAMERDDDKDGCNDVVVWYCLSGSAYDNSPNDVRNNYYFYSKGNVIYTGAGHSTVNQEDEIKLFINAIVAAANVSAVDPDVNFVSELNPAAQVETSRYYATDQANWTNTSSEGNLLEKDMQFYLNIKDYNMVSASLSSENEGTENMTVQFFVDKDGTQSGTPNESSLENITNKIAGLTTYGTGAVINISGNSFSIGNNAYAFTVSDIEQYLKTDSYAYRQNCKIYAKVTSKVTLYGQEYTKTKWASIDLKQRQLFEMD